ncbi:glycosyltransferase [bacterium]|nr:glycosyltransferase [candidate division CSSED10-310 bacterium]
MTRILQLIPAFHAADAIGNNVLTVRNYFRKSGFESEIFFIEADSSLTGKACHYSQFERYRSRDSVVILHYALPSPLNDLYLRSPGFKILVYHNITPPGFLRHYPHLQRIASLGRSALKSLVGETDRALADSQYSRLELDEMGFADTGVMPIFIDFSRYEVPSNPVLEEMFRDDFTNILFVGRLTPNKCQDDLIRLYGFFKRHVRERSRLFLIGKTTGFEKYLFQLSDLASRLKLGDTYFLGHVSREELVTYYRLSDVFISMSEHEGFCVPLIESMFFDLPVLAYNATAVPHTLGGSGVLFDDKSRIPALSEMIGLITRPGPFRDAVVQGQRKRLESFSPSTVGGLWDLEVARFR